MSQSKRPIRSLLTELAGDEPLAVASLYRLSDLTRQEFDQVKEVWSTLTAERRYSIVQHMADISEENFQVDFVPFFGFCLQDAAAWVRRAALEGLWDTDDAHLIKPILALLQNDPDIDVRAAAAATLGHYVLLAEWGQFPKNHACPVIEALLALLNQDRTPNLVRRAALEAVSSASDERIIAHIEAAYHDNSVDLQVAALYAMGNSADKRWIKIVQQEIQNEDPILCEEAIRAAGNIGASDLVEDIIDRLHEHEDLAIRLAAVTALGQLGSEQAREALEARLEDKEAEDLYEAIEEALDEIDTFANLELLRYSGDEEE